MTYTVYTVYLAELAEGFTAEGFAFASHGDALRVARRFNAG